MISLMKNCQYHRRSQAQPEVLEALTRLCFGHTIHPDTADWHPTKLASLTERKSIALINVSVYNVLYTLCMYNIAFKINFP